MSTITKEQLRERARQKVKSLELAVTQTAFADSRAELEEELELASIALASLEAEAVAWKISSAQGTFIGISSEPLDYDAVKYYEQKIEPLYTAPPAPVAVPDDVSGPLAHAYKELTPTFMRNHIDVFERYGIYPDGSAGIQAMRIALDGMNRRAAMLQGAENAESRCSNSPVFPGCSCLTWRPVTFSDSRFVVCPECGNKRCPHANDHRNACTGSNEPGQEGSAYPAAPQQEVK
ncbi:TPA: hypothetical protein N5O02_000690 [Enterobacter asburiae]|nr:hypothetical protein [Enterobacter asburiae]